MTRRIVLHGHFYQPPREGPWLDLVPWEATAAPDHDWNTRITRECYAPLTAARVLDRQGAIRRVINTFERCSFDLGPTLFRWLDRNQPGVSRAIIAADAAAIHRTGFGTAIAMPWHHLILPLASWQDKVTEVRWGIRDFQSRFGRTPRGMWLPETAVDEETLEALVQEGIEFTILAPHQVTNPSANGTPLRWRASGGRSLILVPFHGPASHAVAFSNVLRDAEQWGASLLRETRPDAVITIATDGETYGHHHRFGDLALAALIDLLEHSPQAELISLEDLISRDPDHFPAATLVAPSSWSCEHGVERWRSNCTCGISPGASHSWRAPLRQGIEALSTGIQQVIERDWPASLGEFRQVLDAVGPEFDPQAPELPSSARRLLEGERLRLAMFTSCGWFFDDIGRLEPLIILRLAARALDLLPEADRLPLEAALVARLSETHSVDPGKGSGIEIWERDVISGRNAVSVLAAGLAALYAINPTAAAAVRPAAWDWEVAQGVLHLWHRSTGEQQTWRAQLNIDGVIAWHVHLSDLSSHQEVDILASGFTSPVLQRLREIALPMILDATLTPEARLQLQGGLLDRDQALQAAWEGAWLQVERDGLEVADVLLHAVLDAWMLHRLPPPDQLRVDSFHRLSPLASTAARSGLAMRIGLALP